MRRTALLTIVGLCLLQTLAQAQTLKPPKAVPSAKARPKPRPKAQPQMIAIEVIIVQTHGDAKDVRIVDLSGDSDSVTAKLRELVKAGKMDIVDRVLITTLDQQQAMVQVGRTVAVPTGQVNQGRSGFNRTTYQREQIGTLIQVVAKVEGDLIIMELQVEKSQIRQPAANSAADKNDNSALPETESVTAQSTVGLPKGQTVIVGAMQSVSDSTSSQYLILASAHIVGSTNQAADAAPKELRVFALQNAKAEAAGDVIRQVFTYKSDPPTVAADARTNSLIVHTTPSRLDEIEALLHHLDSAMN